MSAPAPAAEARKAVTEPDALTIFRTRGPRATKLIRRDGTVDPAEPAKFHDAVAIPVSGLAGIRSWLEKIADEPRAFAVRGEMIGEKRQSGILRRMHANSTKNEPATIRDIARRWVALDLDSVPLPPGTDFRDLGRCGTIARATLPVEFRDARCIIQASSSHGIKSGARLRLWFWLSRPARCAEVAVWLDDTGVDEALFSPAQQIFTARPIREDGGADHLPNRIVELPGQPNVLVPDLAQRLAQRERTAKTGTGGTAVPIADLRAALDAIPNPKGFADWNRIGLAVFASAGGSDEGREAFVTWSERDESDPDATASAESAWERFASSPPTGITFGSLVHLAREAVPGWRAPSWGSGVAVAAVDEFQATEDAPAGGELDTGEPTSGAAVLGSEEQLALRFSERHAGQFLFVPDGGGWRTWDGARWQKDGTLAAFDAMRRVCRETAAELSAGDQESRACRVSSAAVRAGALKLAECDSRHVRRFDDFDADLFELNTRAGIVDLRTGETRPHRRGEMVTRVAGATPSGGECPRWLQFIEQITSGDQEFAGFLQRWAGYCLTGDTREQVFLFTHGPGKNGKSLFLDILSAALGDYATAALETVFLATRGEVHPAGLAALRGARLVTVGETEAGARWAESRLKTLTGGDRVSAHQMRQDPFIFTPIFKLTMAGNWKPTIANVDAAMRRRLLLAPFHFVPARADGGLKDALRAELNGILSWAVSGCLDWQRGGLGIPVAVREATEAYFDEQDVLGAWIADRTESAPDNFEPTNALFRDFANFASDRGNAAGTERAFSDALERHAVRVRTKAARGFRGLRLLPPAVDFP